LWPFRAARRPTAVDAAPDLRLECAPGGSTTSNTDAPATAERAYARLSAQDSTFVLVESDGTQPHVCAVALFDPPPQASRGGALDIERVRAYVASRLHLLPHYRQRLSFVPVQGLPIWIDDERFDVAYHVHHAGLPRPGGRRELQAIAARIASHPLDPDRPLWEIWFVEGLDNGGYAVIAKVHHCMVDGVSGVGVMTALLSPSPDPTFAPAQTWTPRPPPSLLDLLTDSVSGIAGAGVAAVRAAGSALSQPLEAGAGVLRLANSAWQTVATGVPPLAPTPLNRPIGRGRRVDWRSLDLGMLRELRKRLDGTLNDVALTVVSGGLARYLRARRVPLRGLGFRVVVPVDMRSGDGDRESANRVSAWFVTLPLADKDPLRRFDKIREQTRRRKAARAASAIDVFLRVADASGSTQLTAWGVRLVSSLRPYHLIVTNVHGPPVPLYLLGARMREFHPLLPLFANQGLAIAMMSYDGQVHVGLNADWDAVPDLETLGDALEASLAELRDAAVRGKRPARRRAPRRPAPAAGASPG
jgi:WS/DGAT/MGAT family acyltransferase